MEAKHFGIKRRQQAVEIVKQIHDTVSGWSPIFAENGVPEKDAKIIGADINGRLEKTSGYLVSG